MNPLKFFLVFATTWTTISANIPILPFDYDPDSPQGPLDWKKIDTSPNEWEKFKKQDHIDLDVVGNECRSTRRPSPINLITNGECRANHEILTREIRYDDCVIDNVTFYRTPHTLRADFPHNDDTCRRPTIDLPNGYPYRWFIHHFEVHIRSEHTLDGRRFDGEIQQYHLGQQDQKRELATVSILLDASGLEDNPRLQEYIDRWEAAAQEEVSNCPNRRNLRGNRDLAEDYSSWMMSEYNTTMLAPSALEDEEHIDSVRNLEEVDEDG